MVTVIIITPITLVDNLKPILYKLEDWFSTSQIINSILTQYFPTLMLMLNNFVIIPLLIDLVAVMEDHETKSGRQVSIM